MPRALRVSAWTLTVLLTVMHANALRGWPLASPAAGRATPPPPAGASESIERVRARVAPSPRRVLLVGGSSMQLALGRALAQQLEGFEALRVWRFGKVSTGLARPDAFSWPAKLEALLDLHHPDLVIASFGGNDAQNIPRAKSQRAAFDTEAWDALYGERIADFVLRIRARGAEAVMIGMPPMRSVAFRKRMERLNRVTREAAERAGGVYLEQWDLGMLPDGSLRERVEEGGRARPMRLDDGIQLSDAGGRYVAAHLLPRLARHVRLVPKDATLAVMEGHTLTSRALRRETHYLAWLPRLADGERVPLLILLHGAYASPSELAERIPALQATAQRARVAIVAPDGAAGGWWLDSPERVDSRYASLVIEDVLADARASLPVNGALGIVGISMGGHGALTLALSHPGLFQSASSLSGVVDLTTASDRPDVVALLGPLDAQRARWEAHSASHMLARTPQAARDLALRISCGSTDPWIGANRALHARAESLRLAHDYDEAPFGHEWPYWERIVPEHVVWHAEKLRAADLTQTKGQ